MLDPNGVSLGISKQPLTGSNDSAPNGSEASKRVVMKQQMRPHTTMKLSKSVAKALYTPQIMSRASTHISSVNHTLRLTWMP